MDREWAVWYAHMALFLLFWYWAMCALTYVWWKPADATVTAINLHARRIEK